MRNPCISPGRLPGRPALLATLCVLLAACGAPRFRAEPPVPVEPPVAAETWMLVGTELRQVADDAGQAAYDYAKEAMGRWFQRVSAATESEFVPWATDYWTHQWLSVKLAWYGTNEADGNAGALARLTDYLADEYGAQVLEPVAKEIDPLQVMDQASEVYANALASGIREVQQRYALPSGQLAAWLAGIPLITPPPGASLQDLVDAARVTDLAAYRALTARTGGKSKAQGLAGLDAAMRPVAERTAERLSATLAVRGGAGAASLLGGVPGMLVGLGISAWDATAHERERPALETVLRSELDGALRTALWQLLHDQTAGVLAPVAHMATRLDGMLPTPPVPPLIEAGPVQGLF